MSETFLFFSSSDWDGLWGSRQQVARRLAEQGHRVFFVEQMAGWEHFWKYPDLVARRRQNRRKPLRQLQPNLYLLTPPPFLAGRYYAPKIASLNGRLMRRWLQKTLRPFTITAPILWLYKPEHTSLIGHFNEKIVVYHCIDEFTVGTNGRKKAIIQQLEETLLRQATIVFANSTLTYQSKLPFNPNSHRIPSGADVPHFAQAADPTTPIAPDIAQLPHPIFMYIGSINEKIDLPLLHQIGREHPHASLVLIGQLFTEHINADLLNLPNIHYLGKRPFDQLPSYLRAADLCLLPYVQGEATRYRSPLKLYEYLATGKPIISTPHPEVDELNRLVTIRDAAHFSAEIEPVLAHDTAAQQGLRLKAASQHTWDKRVSQMLSHIGIISCVE